MDPATAIALAFAAFKGVSQLMRDLNEPDLTPEQIAQKKAIELASRQVFDAYVAEALGSVKPAED